MTRVPKFSIVTPSFNQGPFIEATLRSVADQEGSFDIEYFVMDGGSTDESVEIISRYADLINGGHYPIRCHQMRVHWTSGKDGGQSDAINRGLRSASGDYAAYINSDDVYLPGAFANVAKAFEQHRDADLIYGDGDVINQEGQLQWEWLSRPYKHRVMTTYHFLWNDFTNYIMQQSTFWRISVHQDIGLFDESFHYAMDVEYWIRAGASGLRLQHIPKKLAGFRMIQGTKSLSGPNVFWTEFLEIYRRHQSVSKLHLYLAYYYFNVAKHCKWDLETARAEADLSLTRWNGLAADEQRAIEKQCFRAYAAACFLIANALQREGDYTRAARYITLGLKNSPRAVASVGGICSVLKQLAGSWAGRYLDKITDWLIGRYRSIRFDYRYAQRGS